MRRAESWSLFVLCGAWHVRRWYFFTVGRRHHPTIRCGKRSVTFCKEAACALLLRLCAGAPRSCTSPKDTSSLHGQADLCAVHCLLSTACPAMLFCMPALLCMHAGTCTCLLTCCLAVLLSCCLATVCFIVPIFADHALGQGLHVDKLFEWCVQDLTLRPQPGIRGGFGRDCK